MSIYICRECNDIAYNNLRKKLDKLINKYEDFMKNEPITDDEILLLLMKELREI